LEIPQLPLNGPLDTVELTPPVDGVDVARFARHGEWPREVKHCIPQLVEEYVLETDRGQGKAGSNNPSNLPPLSVAKTEVFPLRF